MATFALKPAPARNLGVTYKMTKLPPIAPPCVPDVLKLVWFTDASGDYSETAEAAYLLPEPDLAAGPVLAVAGILGETCDAPIQWIAQWTPEGTGGEPGLFQDGNRLVVWPKLGSGPGLLTVRAHIAGKSYGPIVLTILRYECAGYGYEYNAGTMEFVRVDVASYFVAFGEQPFFYSSATVIGGWPVGTEFVWGLSGGGDYSFHAQDNSAICSIAAYSAPPVLFTVTATSPSGETRSIRGEFNFG